MKAKILPLAKSAIKCFFDIDPVITESVVMHALAQGQLLHSELRQALRANVEHRKARIIDLMESNTHSWNAA